MQQVTISCCGFAIASHIIESALPFGACGPADYAPTHVSAGPAFAVMLFSILSSLEALSSICVFLQQRRHNPLRKNDKALGSTRYCRVEAMAREVIGTVDPFLGIRYHDLVELEPFRQIERNDE